MDHFDVFDITKKSISIQTFHIQFTDFRCAKIFMTLKVFSASFCAKNGFCLLFLLLFGSFLINLKLLGFSKKILSKIFSSSFLQKMKIIIQWYFYETSVSANMIHFSSVNLNKS